MVEKWVSNIGDFAMAIKNRELCFYLWLKLPVG
jgi:hypothetical protein